MIFLAKISFQLDSAFPRDAVTISPHYFGDDAQGLANALKTNLIANTLIGATMPFTIKVYNAEKAPPNYPLAQATNGSGSHNTNVPREVALCLSYYSTYNRPSYRGRLFIPAAFVQGQVDLRPTSTQIANALSFKTALGSGLPAQTNWVVYSRKLGQSFGVSNVWVDDEWDTVRSRGLKSTTRQLATVP